MTLKRVYGAYTLSIGIVTRHGIWPRNSGALALRSTFLVGLKDMDLLMDFNPVSTLYTVDDCNAA